MFLQTNLQQFISPEKLLEYFELTDAQKTSDSYTFYLSEKNIHPQEYTNQKLQSKGFFMREYLSNDETSLSQGELYIILTNKSANGHEGGLKVMIKGTESDADSKSKLLMSC